MLGPALPRLGDQVGNWDMKPDVGWTYPGLFGIRCRKVSETLIISNQVTTNSALGSVDLVYGTVPSPYNATTAGEAVHANNVIVGLPGARGWLRPTAENAAGWKFINCGVDGLTAGSNPSASISPVGSLTFAYLPGQFSDPSDQWQSGPFEAQEYDISDGAKFGGGTAVLGRPSAGWRHRQVQGALRWQRLETHRMTDKTFTDYQFVASGAPTSRTLPVRLSDMVNVKDWGAVGNGVTDDTDAIQAATSFCLHAWTARQ